MAKARKIVRADKRQATLREADAMATEYRTLNDTKKSSEKRMATLKPSLLDFLEREGEKDENGAISVDTGDNVVVQSFRKGTVIDDRAAQKLLDKATYMRITKRFIDKDLLEEAHAAGSISDDVMRGIVGLKHTPVFTVKAAQ